MRTYTITAAAEGGFIVMDGSVERGYYSPPKFAGSLADCIAWLNRRLGEVIPQQIDQCVKAVKS